MDKEAFLSQPEYQLFRQAYAERKAPLVVICGSGLSTPAGLPTWSGLRGTLQKDAEAKNNLLNQIGQAIQTPKIKAAKAQPDMWVAFKLLKEVLTKPVFEQIVERELTPSDRAELPAGYRHLLRLDMRGLITLNLDKFAGEALSEYRYSERITPIYGNEIAKKWELIQSMKTYLVYLHGGIHDPSTWIMTQDDFLEIQSSVGHEHFLRTVFMENIVLFVGVSADDISVSGRLLELASSGFRPRNLYWLTNRLDSAMAVWADSAYVSLIQYSAAHQAEHTDVIRTLVEDCVGYVSEDKPEPPLTGSTRYSNPVAGVPTDPDALAQEDPETIRRTIAGLLEDILAESGDTDIYEKYREFCATYDYAVHRAFYKGRQDKFRTWFGYELGTLLGRGNFGEVYSAKDANGELVAVKIMHESIFSNDDMLGGFRRGVRSMRIVTNQSVPGMVPIKESFELPPTIIMPYVAGHSLEESLQIRPDLSWRTKLSIALSIGRIVSAGHALPQTVLHRDLKPSNVMIQNLEYDGEFYPEVVVLDFDMSWHKGSKERDVVFESRDDFGYLSPEQTDPTNRNAARSTRVDSYGFGMTMFYLFGLTGPRPNEALSDLWFDRALHACERGYQEAWRSAPIRLARLITRATQIDQSHRVDFSTMVSDLDFLISAIDAPSTLNNPELWAEEILANMTPSSRYSWNDAIGEGVYSNLAGISARSIGNFRTGSVEVEIRYSDQGQSERGSLSKYLRTAASNATREFERGGWKILDSRTGGAEALVRAECQLTTMKQDHQPVAQAASAAMRALQF